MGVLFSFPPLFRNFQYCFCIYFLFPGATVLVFKKLNFSVLRESLQFVTVEIGIRETCLQAAVVIVTDGAEVWGRRTRTRGGGHTVWWL